MSAKVSKVTPFLWYAREAEEAVRLYVSLIPNSKVDHVWTLQAQSPSGPPGTVKVIGFTLGGVQFQAMEAGKMDDFNHAVSLMVHCEDQAEIDRLWDALGEGGSYEACGWLKDRFGVSWQITPAEMAQMMGDPDTNRSRRVAEAMLKMVKLDIAKLRAAYEGSE